MARQVKARQSRKNVELGRRELWLAGLGAVSLGRKQALATFQAINSGAVKLSARARADLASAVEQASGVIEQSVERAGSTLQEGRKQAHKLLQPALAKLGWAEAPSRRTPARRKPAARKSAARKSARTA